MSENNFLVSYDYEQLTILVRRTHVPGLCNDIWAV